MNNIDACRLMLALAAALAADVSAAPSKKPFHYVEQYKTAMKRQGDADGLLLDNMRMTADLLEDFRRRHGHFPESGVEQEQVRARLLSQMHENPYSAAGINGTVDPHPCEIVFTCNMQLNRDRANETAGKIPPDWIAKPGTITVVTNSENLILIWGAGPNQRPVTYAKTGNAQLIIRDLSD